MGQDGWDRLNKTEKKMWRKRFKTIFLGVLYGLGKKSLSERLNCSIQESEQIIQGLYKSFPKLREYVATQGQYPLDHQGAVNTVLGDRLVVPEYKYLIKAIKEGNEYEEKSLKARIQRLGVNLPIQGGTSSIMASGFFEDIRVSLKEGWKRPLQPIIVVHDSNTNYVPVSKFFSIDAFYKKNFTKYCEGITPHITLLFDLMIGTAYENCVPLKQINNNTVEVSGSAYQLIGLYDKLMNNDEIQVECNVKREDLVPQFVTNPIERFILEKGTSIIKDLSNYTIQFHKVS